MTKTVLAWAALWTPLSIILFCAWWYVAFNNDYGALAGTYVFEGNGEKCILYLRQDRTFAQEFHRSGELHKSEGHWHRYGVSHVSFSNEFLKLSGEEMNAAGEAHANLAKRLGYSHTSFWHRFQTVLSSIRSCFVKGAEWLGWVSICMMAQSRRAYSREIAEIARKPPQVFFLFVFDLRPPTPHAQ